jgi:hypothetical protein
MQFGNDNFRLFYMLKQGLQRSRFLLLMTTGVRKLPPKRVAFFADKVVDSDFGMESEFQAKLTFHYLEIPLNLNYQIELGDWKWQLTGGPTIGYMADFRMQSSQKMTLMGLYAPPKRVRFKNRKNSNFKTY